MAESLKSKNLKISIIDPVGQKAGMDHYDISLAKALINRACNVNVYSNFTDASGMTIQKFDTSFSKSIIRYFGLIGNYLSALKSSKQNKTEIVISHVFHSSFIDFLLLKVTSFLGFRSCVIIHDIESFLSPGSNSRIRKITAIADFVIVHNKISYSELEKKIDRVDLKKINIVPHGNYLTLPVKTDKFSVLNNFGLDQSYSYIMFFGIIKKSKGLDTLIEAMKDVNEDVHLVVAGRLRDISISEYESMINKSGLKNRIHSFTRYINNEERNMLFNAVDLVVLPYRRIYQSGVMLMAMSYGVPVIASDLPGNRLNGFADGVFFKAGDSSQLAEKINVLLCDEKKRKSISKSSVEYVSLNHSWEKIADSLIKILN